MRRVTYGVTGSRAGIQGFGRRRWNILNSRSVSCERTVLFVGVIDSFFRETRTFALQEVKEGEINKTERNGERRIFTEPLVFLIFSGRRLAAGMGADRKSERLEKKEKKKGNRTNLS